MDVAAALATLGWTIRSSTGGLRQAVWDFQLGWNLGPALALDGNAGPITRAAIQVSLDNRKAGLPDFSANFAAVEFRCPCDRRPGGPYLDCRRIWITRATVQGAEALRPVLGRFTPRTGCRCPGENMKVAGAKNSQHLYGSALDLGTNEKVYNVTAETIQRLKRFSGIGYYELGTRKVVRHVDTRHVSPHRTAGTVTAPAMWKYGELGSRTLLKPTPITATTPTPTPTPTPAPVRSWFDMATKEDLRSVVQEELEKRLSDEQMWRRVLTSMAFFKDPATPNRGEDPSEARIPLGRLNESTGIAVQELREELAGSLSPESLEAAVRAALGEFIKSVGVTVVTDKE